SYSRIPPPTSNSSPVTQPESSDARKRAAFAISSAVPMRPRGVRVTASCSKPFLYSGSASTPSVSVAPGESELTRIFRGASSKASAREITSTAPFGSTVHRAVDGLRLHRNSVAAGLHDFLSHLFRARLVVGIIHNDVRSFRPQLFGDRCPDSFRCASDNRYLAIQFRHTRPLPRSVK